jgi:sugar lactone lactonase YvrE
MSVLLEGLVFGESPRWHDQRLWVSDWGAGRVLSVGADAQVTVEAQVASFPMCIDFLPDGRLLVVSSADRQVLLREPDGALVVHADLAPVSLKPWNEIVVHASGNAYVNSIGFDFPGEQPGPGIIVLVRSDGQVAPVAADLAFPNGMAITSDGQRLIVAESHAEQLTAYDIAADGSLSGRRVWAATPGDHPDGICLDATGALWYADVANRHCVRVREGGEALDTFEVERGAFACALSQGAQPQLFVVEQDWHGPGADSHSAGRVVAVAAPAPGIAS